MKIPGMVEALHEAWSDSPTPLEMDPTRKFAMLGLESDKNIEIQNDAKQKANPLEELHDKLVQLKLDILDESTLF